MLRAPPGLKPTDRRIDTPRMEVNMGFSSRVLLVLCLAAIALGDDGVSDPARANGTSVPIKRVALEQARSSRLSARWIGQDGHDYAGPNGGLGPSDIQDIHIALAGLDPRLEVVFVEVSSTNGNVWRFAEKPDSCCAVFKRQKAARTGDVYFEPAWVETGRPFHVLVRYDDGSTVETDLRGGKADHKLRVTTVALAARWIGQDRQDRTGTGPSVGADGSQDVRIDLSRLSTKLNLLGLRITAPGGASWEAGTNPKLLSSADLVRDPKDPSQADLFFQPVADMSGQRLKLTAVYQDDQVDATTVAAGRCDPKLRVSQPPLPRLTALRATAAWLGQDGSNPNRPGDVHVVISGLPAGAGFAGAVLANSQRGMWVYRRNDRAAVAADTSAEPLLVKPRSDGKSLDMFFPPSRDESKSTMTLRLIATDGRSSIVRFPGGSCDLAKRSLGAAEHPGRRQAGR